MKPHLILIFLALTTMSVIAAKIERPNILFAIADDWSHPHASAYGCRWVKTPAFDRVAREGILLTPLPAPMRSTSEKQFPSISLIREKNRRVG
ncbi:MAG: hypothetical protein FJ395_18945 [Verrucomicrobia bacterium]|nr:hypothetical protein [Verrucomicrobiota bacterium]